MRQSLWARVLRVGLRKEAAEEQSWVRRDELFSECHTRGCQMAFLHPAAFPRSRLDTFGFVHLEGSFHPLNAHCVHTALLLTRCRELFSTPKTVPWTCGVLLCTAWLGPKARAAP